MKNLIVLNVFILHSREKILRAYIPFKSARWFNSFVQERTEIDLWLSPRLIKNILNSGNFTNTNEQYTYYAEFKVNSIKDWQQITNELVLNGIKLQILVDDVEKYLSGVEFIKTKRDTTQVKNKYSTLKRKVVGRYPAYNDIVQWMVVLILILI